MPGQHVSCKLVVNGCLPFCLERQPCDLQRRKVGSTDGGTCVENLIAFHTQPGSDLNVTKGEQQSQKQGHIFWKNQKVRSEESPPLPSLGLSLHICETSVLQRCAEDCQNEVKGPEEHTTLSNPLMRSGSWEPQLLEG